MSDQSHLREALLQVQRGLDVAKLGLNRDGVQHAKIVKLEGIVAEALSAPSFQTLSADEPHWVDKLRGELSYVMDDSEDGSGPGNPEHDNMVEQALCSVREVVEPLLARTTPALSVESAAGVSIEALQAAHVARQEEWCPDQKPDLSFRGNEMAGEVGEACNVIKKLERERQGWRGSRATVDDLGDELADVIHTAILCSITAGIELGPRVVAKFNATSEKNGLATTLAAAPAPNPSPAAKGGEAVVIPYDDFYAAYRFVPRSKMSPDCCLKTRLRSLLRAEDLAYADEAEALATPSPQPAEAVREAEWLAERLLAAGATYREDERRWYHDELRQQWLDESPAEYLGHILGFRRGLEHAALASDPAPAGEAVEPVGFINESFRDGLVEQKGKGYWHHQMVCGKRFDGSFPIYLAHPAPEDIARLREDLERVTRERDTFADICLVVSGHLELPHSESGPCDDSRRYDRELTSLEALYRRTEDERVEHMGKRFKAEAEAETFKRERDDARKALETAREDCTARDNDIVVLLGNLNWLEKLSGEFLEGDDAAVVSQIGADLKARRAARSASREGASDE